MKRGFSLFPLVLAALLAGTTFWLEHFVRTQAKLAAANQRHDPDMVAHNAVQERFDLTGKRQYVLTAAELVHFPDKDTTEARQARLDHFGKPPASRLTADKALISEGGTEVLLTGNVFAQRDAAPGIPASTLQTSELRVWPDEERAATDAPVHMTRGHAVIDGVGMTSDQINGTTVIGQVRATLIPSPKERRK